MPLSGTFWRCVRRLGGSVVVLALAGLAHGEVTPEQPGSVTLGPPSPSWFIVKNVMGSGSVFDAADGEMLGTLSLTPWTPTVVTHPGRGEVYAAEVFYARQYDGERTDVLRIYAHETLAPVAEVPLPPKVASLHPSYMALLAGNRYVVVFNMTPAQSVSVVDVVERRFVGEISTPGCASTLAAGERGFLMVCGNGTLQWIGLDADGEEAARVRSEVFFDVDKDPLLGKPVPSGDGWQFMTFAGQVMTASVENGSIVVGEAWSLLGEDDEGWWPGGTQPFTVHDELGLLVVLTHKGEKDTPDEAGTEAWVFHRAGQRRVGKIEFEEPVGAVQVVEGEVPLLLGSSGGGVLVYELATGRLERTIEAGRGGFLLPYSR